MRWTSSGSRVTGRSDLTTTGPILMFGTKWPSMTSTWIRSAPARSASRTWSPRRAKSAARMEGANLMVMVEPFPVQIHEIEFRWRRTNATARLRRLDLPDFDEPLRCWKSVTQNRRTAHGPCYPNLECPFSTDAGEDRGAGW